MSYVRTARGAHSETPHGQRVCIVNPGKCSRFSASYRIGDIRPRSGHGFNGAAVFAIATAVPDPNVDAGRQGAYGGRGRRNDNGDSHVSSEPTTNVDDRYVIMGSSAKERCSANPPTLREIMPME